MFKNSMTKNTVPEGHGGGSPNSQLFEDDVEDLVRETQKHLGKWRVRTKRKQFRFQSFQGTF